jgi:hypothetical protein
MMGDKRSPDGARKSGEYGMDDATTDYEHTAMMNQLNPNF